MRIFVVGLVLFFCSYLGGLGQTLFPEDGEVFRDDIIPIVRITIDPDSLDAIYENTQSDHEYPAIFEFDNGEINEKLTNIGFRVRGNTSRSSNKKSFKVSFNTFDKKQKFFGLEKMNLNGEHNDPSIIRSKLGWDICRELSIPASRSNHIRLFINDVYWGLYINVEHVDEEFVDLRFGSKEGNLYKCLWPADLVYKGNSPDLYKMENGGRRAYELKTNELEDDYSDLAEFIDVLNKTPLNLLETELPKVFNIDRYLSCMVMDIFTGNWDGPLFNKNNFYLYHNPENDLFEFIPYDLDNTFGIDWFNVDWSSRDVYNWSASWSELPLYERIMDVPEYREEFTRRFREFIENMVDSKNLENEIWRIKDLIRPFVGDDPFYPGDYGWGPSDFDNSYTARISTNHVKSGLLSYISTRSVTAKSQLDVLGIMEFPEDTYLAPYPNPALDYIYLPEQQTRKVWLFTLSGSIVKYLNIDGRPGVIPVGDISSGSYLIKQELTDGRIISQLVIVN